MANLPSWISVDHVVGAEWVVENIVYLDSSESGGRVNIYVTTIDGNGAPVSGIGVFQDWKDDRVKQYTMGGQTDFPQSGDSSFDPNRGEVGPYGVYVDGSSEQVWGMGLPLKQHVVYQITFRKGGTPPPPPGDYVTVEQAQAMIDKSINAAFERGKVVA